MRTVFFGSPAFATPSLRALLGTPFRPSLVVTPPDRPRGRGLRVEPSPIARIAEQAGVALLRAEWAPAAEEVRSLLGGERPDLLAVVSYGAILRRDLLDLPRLGAWNVHASLLPRHRGASPVAAAILAGDERTGVSVQAMAEKLDAGPVLLVEETEIGERETAGELSERLARMAAEILPRALAIVAEGNARPVPQDESRATRAPRLRREDGTIDWTRSARAIDRLVRAMTPWPGATTACRGRPLVVRSGEPIPEATRGRPGEVLTVGSEGFEVATGDGRYLLRRVHPAGGKEMSAAEFARGRGVAAGDVLGP
jgi:methionyl-tRNA formyltransferase